MDTPGFLVARFSAVTIKSMARLSIDSLPIGKMLVACHFTTLLKSSKPSYLAGVQMHGSRAHSHHVCLIQNLSSGMDFIPSLVLPFPLSKCMHHQHLVARSQSLRYNERFGFQSPNNNPLDLCTSRLLTKFERCIWDYRNGLRHFLSQIFDRLQMTGSM